MKKLATYDTIKKIVKYMKSNFIRTSDPIFRQPSTAYAVGDVVYVKGAGVKYHLSCVTAGTTSADELAIPSGAKAGDSITDGTAIWKVEEIEGMITAIESLSKAIKELQAETQNEIEAAKTTISQTLNTTIDVKLTNLGYQQVTKLNTSAYKGVDIPIKANADFVRPPISVLKLRDDGITETDTACEFNDGDASDFVANDGVVFTGGIMKPRTTFEIAMTEPTELASGYISNTELIDMTNYKAVKAVDVR